MCGCAAYLWAVSVRGKRREIRLIKEHYFPFVSANDLFPAEIVSSSTQHTHVQSKGSTPSRAKRVTFDVWARSFCVHIITRWWRFAWLCEYVCVLNTCRTFIIFFWETLVDVFRVRRCQSLCPMWRLRLTQSEKAKKFALYAARWSAGATFSFSEGGVKRVSFWFFFLFVVNIDRVIECVFWCGYGFLLNRFLTVWVCFDFWPHLIIPCLHTF